MECGTVSVEHCKGDQLNMFLILRPDSDYACSMDGFRTLIGVYGILNVNGRCQSNCAMHYAYIYDVTPPVSNNGVVNTAEQVGTGLGK